MASPTLYNALKTFLTTTFSPIQVLDFDQIEPQLEQSVNTFLVLQEVYGSSQPTSFGDPVAICMRERSSLVVHSFVPAPESSSQARTLADRVRTNLTLQRLNGVRVLEASTPMVELLNDGLWSAATVDVEAELDYHVAVP